jgi:SHS2 domain-containing protein
MVKQKYEWIEHTADVAVRIFGKNLDELFSHAGQALFEVIGECPVEKLSRVRRIELETDGVEELLLEWLSEINYLHQTHREVYNDFRFDRLSEKHLEGAVAGEPIDEEHHLVEQEIKAVTYHELQVSRQEDGWSAVVVFDV